MQYLIRLVKNHRLLLGFLALAVLLRIFLLIWVLPYLENADLLRYEDWGRIAHIYGFADTYTPKHLQIGKTANNQPPGSLYIISAMYEVYVQEVRIVSKVTHTIPGTFLVLDRNLENITFKIPSLLTDIFLGLLVYFAVRKQTSQNKALLAACFIWFNPVFFYNSILWGQMDSINNFLFFVSLFFLFRKKLFLSILFFCLSLFVKLSLLPFLPFYLFILLLLFPLRKIVLYISLSIAFLFLLTLSISHTNLLWLPHFIATSSAGETENITIFAYNFWWMILHPSLKMYTPANNAPFFFFTYALWGYILFILFSIPLITFIYKYRMKLSRQYIFAIFALVALLLFLFLPKMHERYLFPFFPLFAAYIAYKAKYIILFLLLILFHLTNLYVVWHPVWLPFSDQFLYTPFWGLVASIGIFFVSLDIYKNVFVDITKEDRLKKVFISVVKFVKLPR